MSRFNTSKLLIWTLFTCYLLFGFGGAVIAACCPDAPGGYQARRALCCQGEAACSPAETLHQAATDPTHKKACLDHCNPGQHSRLHLPLGQSSKHFNNFQDIVVADSISFTQPPLPADFSTISPQGNVPQLTLVALRTVVLLI